VIGVPDALKGSAIVCVCVAARNVQPDAELEKRLKSEVAAALGASFRPRQLVFVSDLPKTRTMKIMRRLVRSTILGEAPGDLAGLVNPEALEDLRGQALQLVPQSESPQRDKA
jgi:acetyl-CoA synthetase